MENQTDNTTIVESEIHWHAIGNINLFPDDAGRCAKINGMQIAVFHFKTKNKWYACQNLCPHKQEMVLARGLVGDSGGTPKVACPLHKNTFSLDDGTNLNGELEAIKTFPVSLKEDIVYIGLKS